MLDADRCDVLQLIEGQGASDQPRMAKRQHHTGQQRHGHSDRCRKTCRAVRSYQADPDKRHFEDQRTPTLKFFAKALETRSLLIIPDHSERTGLGLLGLHDTRSPREWLDEEVAFLESIARQLAIGYQYTSLYVAQEQESRRTKRYSKSRIRSIRIRILTRFLPAFWSERSRWSGPITALSACLIKTARRYRLRRLNGRRHQAEPRVEHDRTAREIAVAWTRFRRSARCFAKVKRCGPSAIRSCRLRSA